MTVHSWLNPAPLRIALVSVLLLLFIPVYVRGIEAQQMAPSFTLSDLSGEEVSLVNYRGKIVLLDFWATWCIPCRKSMPELAELDRKFRNKGVVILGLSIDDPDTFDNAYVGKFKAQFKVDYPILRADKTVTELYLGTENASVPTLFIINREGKIVEKHVGFEPGAIEKSLQKLLKSK